MEQKFVVVVTGPTATGKTALGVELAQRLDGEVISADSMQIYREMDIGTAKVTEAEQRGIPHHLINVADPEEDWSVARWVAEAAKVGEEIFQRGKLPILVGGTGLYIDSLLSGWDFSGGETDAALREELNREYDQVGGAAFRERLRQVDPERAEKLHPADKKRLVRAMEVWRLTGETITAHDARTRAQPERWASLRFALNFRDRQRLYGRIDQRVDEMVRDGLFEEVEGLLLGGLRPDCTAMQAIGYKEVAAYFRGELSGGDAVDQIKRESRRYAKRQLTWLRRDSKLRWIVWDGAPEVSRASEEIVAYCKGVR